jgi:signal transduction histidine kinase
MTRVKQILLPFNRDLRWQLFSLYLLSVVLVFAAGLFFAITTNKQLTTETEFTDLALAQAIAQETQSSIQPPIQAVQYLARQPGVVGADLAVMAELFEIIQETSPEYNLVYRHDYNATMVYHYPEGPNTTVGVNFAFRPYSQRARTMHEPFVSLGRISATMQEPVATVINPLWNGQEYLGIVAINIDLPNFSQNLSDLIHRQNINKPSLEIFVIDQTGQILASLEPDLLLTSINKIFPYLPTTTLPLPSGNSIETDTAAQEFLFSYAPVAEAEWTVIVSRPTEVAFDTSYRFQRSFLFLLEIYLGIGILFWIVLSRRMIFPLQDITAYLKGRQLEAPSQHAEAHPLAHYTARPDQLGHLGKSVIDAEKVIRSRLDELTTLLETSTAVTSSLDIHTVLESILAQVEQILKIDKSAIITYQKQTQRFQISASRRLSSEYVDRMSKSDSRERLAWQALERSEIVQISDLTQQEQPERIAPGVLAEGVRAVLVLPLKTTHAQPSLLVVYKTQPYTFTQGEANLLNNFANHAVMALENATLYAQSDILLKEQTRRLEALVHSLGDGLVLEDLTGNIRYTNRWMSDFTGLPMADIQQSSITTLLKHLQARVITTKHVDPNLPAGDKIFALPDENRVRYLRSEIFEVTDYEAQAIGRGLLLQDITRDYEVDRMKSLLISTVSHELRTPLASIKGYASTLLADDVEWNVAEQREFLEIISREADRLNRMVNDLLDMSRLEAGRLQLAPVPCQLSGVVLKAATQVRPTPYKRLQIDLPPNLPPLIADPQRLEVVVRNLIENAVKYAGPDTPIIVSAQAQNGRAVVYVTDRGPGIPEPHRRHIFEAFYRVDDGLTRQSGFGLGLAICQGFIQAQGGRIWIEPKSGGTCIAFSLPLYQEEE